MRLAAVDIGSNTVHALVADVVRGRLEDVAHYVEMPELGAHVAKTGAIGARGRVVIRALRKVLAQAATHHYAGLIAGATQPVRQATDGEAFARQAGDAIGTAVHSTPAPRDADPRFLALPPRHSPTRQWATAV